MAKKVTDLIVTTTLQDADKIMVVTDTATTPTSKGIVKSDLKTELSVTHTGEVTGTIALSLDKTSITNQTTVTADGADTVIIIDATDGALKNALISDFASAGGTVTSVAVSGSDGIQVDSGSPITVSGTIALGIDKTALLIHINVEDGATADQTKADIDALGIDADTLDSIDSGQFLRSDVLATKTGGNLIFNNFVQIALGTASAGSLLFYDNANNILDLKAGDFKILDNTASRFTFSRTTGNFTATGAIAGSNLSNTNTGDVPLGFAIGDETTDLSVATGVFTITMPNYATTLTDVSISLVTAPTGSVATFDINEGGTTLLSTKITIDATEKTSETAATAPVISDSAIAANAVITVDVDGIGSTIAGAGGKVWLYIERA